MAWRRGLVLALLAAAAHAAVAVAHAPAPEATLATTRLRDALVGRIATWSDGTPITLVLVEEAGSAAVVARVTGRDLDQLLRGWKRLVFAGMGAMPVVVATPRAALEEVARKPGAIAVLADDPHAAGVAVVWRDEGKAKPAVPAATPPTREDARAQR